MESTTLPHTSEVSKLVGCSTSWMPLLHQTDCPKPPLRVLFLSTQNSARSQMAEALLHHLSHETIEAYSAGSSPARRIHPLALHTMEAASIDMHEQYPKHFDRYRGQHFDAIVTISDRVHSGAYRLPPDSLTFPDRPEYIHWSFPNPVKATGSDEEQYAVFKQVGLQLTTRLRLFMTVLNRKHQ